KADRQLVEDVARAAEVRAELRGETDALSLASRERDDRSIEAQVVEADVDQESEPRVDLRDDGPRDRRDSRRRAPRRKERSELRDARLRQLGDAMRADPHGRPRRREPRSLAGLARDIASIALEEGVALLVVRVRELAHDRAAKTAESGAPTTMEEDFERLARPASERPAILGKPVDLRERAKEARACATAKRRLVEERERTARMRLDRKREVAHERLGVELASRAHATAIRAL